MDKLLYVAMSGAAEVMDAQAIRANNLANASTPGFKAQLEQARSMPVYGDGFPTRVYAASESPGNNLATGSFRQTGNQLHAALQGDGWFAVEAEGIPEAYTRRGDFTLSTDNFLINGAGQRVLGNGGPINIPPAESIQIATDGTVSITPLGSAPGTVAVLDVIKLVNPDTENFVQRTDGLFVNSDGAVNDPDPSVRLVTGGYETSNVNAVAELVDMIALARRYELDVKTMQTAEEIDQAAAQILQFT